MNKILACCFLFKMISGFGAGFVPQMPIGFSGILRWSAHSSCNCTVPLQKVCRLSEVSLRDLHIIHN